MLKTLYIRIWLESGIKKRIVILLGAMMIVVILSAGTYLALKKGSSSEGSDVRLKIIPENVDLQLKDVHFTEVGDPDLTWEINAETAKFVKKDNLAFFDRVRIRLIRSDGKTLTLTGNEGRLHTDTRDAEVTGSVVVVSNNGDIVETDRLHYSHADRRIFTDQKITLRNPRMVVSGIGMSLTLADERVSLQSGVKALVKAENKMRGRGKK